MYDGGHRMKRRYNNEIKQWDIVLTEEEYAMLDERIKSLEHKLAMMSFYPKPLGPYEVPNPYKCSYPCNCSGACFKHQFERNAPIQTWSSTIESIANFANGKVNRINTPHMCTNGGN